MRMRIFLGVVAALSAIAAFAGPRADMAVACSCAAVDPARELSRFDAAFVGTVLFHRVEHPNKPLLSSADPAFWTFSVERAVKGMLPSPLVVRTAASGASCGLELEQGQRVGLLLDRDGTAYLSGLCSQVDPDRLARLALPRAQVIAASEEDDSLPWWPAVVGGSLAAAGVVAFAFRRRRT